MATRPRIGRATLLAAIHELAALSSAEDRSPEEEAALRGIVQRLATRTARAKAHLEARAALALVEALRAIYQGILDDRTSTRRFPNERTTFEAVSDAVRDWAASTGSHDHDALTQRQLEELELDADEILLKGADREATGPGTARRAAIVMVEEVLGIPQRTTYDRVAKGRLSPIREGELDIDGVAAPERAIRAIATCLEATAGVDAETALAEARGIYERRIRALLPDLT